MDRVAIYKSSFSKYGRQERISLELHFGPSLGVWTSLIILSMNFQFLFSKI